MYVDLPESKSSDFGRAMAVFMEHMSKFSHSSKESYATWTATNYISDLCFCC